MVLEIIHCRVFSLQQGVRQALPIAKQWKSYLKESNDSITVITKTKVPADAILGCNKPLSEDTKQDGIRAGCKAYETIYINKPLIPTGTHPGS